MAQQTDSTATAALPESGRRRDSGGRDESGGGGADGGRGAGRASARRWAALLALLVGLFLVDELPPYLRFDPAKARINLDPQVPWHYAVLVAHIAFGSIALVTVVLQLWPGLRRTRPRLHRLSGRLYVYAGALPCAVTALVIMPLMPEWRGDIGIALQALLWIATTVAGTVAARRHRWAEHRRWMLRSFALAAGVLWGRAMVDVMVHTGAPVPLDYLFEVARWLGWMVNLVLVQLWLDRKPRRRLPVSA
ncbi:DUF2306 domain-containing protein [Kitasatospora sp. NPDC057518]|uniref:DUF2306 domain-containing protein n=1 Tax=Kitasatospora sp. NPDC057518 TaxID=3346155 RepID=UPI0036C7C2DD